MLGAVTFPGFPGAGGPAHSRTAQSILTASRWRTRARRICCVTPDAPLSVALRGGGLAGAAGAPGAVRRHPGCRAYPDGVARGHAAGAEARPLVTVRMLERPTLRWEMARGSPGDSGCRAAAMGRERPSRWASALRACIHLVMNGVDTTPICDRAEARAALGDRGRISCCCILSALACAQGQGTSGRRLHRAGGERDDCFAGAGGRGPARAVADCGAAPDRRSGGPVLRARPLAQVPSCGRAPPTSSVNVAQPSLRHAETFR